MYTLFIYIYMYIYTYNYKCVYIDIYIFVYKSGAHHIRHKSGSNSCQHTKLIV